MVIFQWKKDGIKWHLILSAAFSEPQYVPGDKKGGLGSKVVSKSVGGCKVRENVSNLSIFFMK